MKKIFLLSLLFISSTHTFVLNAAKRQRILFTPEFISRAQQRIQTDTLMASAWKQIQNTADEQLKRNDFRKSDYLALAYLMTGDARYADKAKELLLKQTARKDWSDREMILRKPAWNSELQMAHNSFYAAIVYETIYDRLSASERKQIATDLTRLALRPALGDWLIEPYRIHSLNSMGHNWWTSCVCMGGVLGLVLQDEVPEARSWTEQINEHLPEWFAFEGDVLQHKPKSFDRNGGMYESINYANFGIQEALLFRLAWKHAHPGQALADIPELKNITSFFCQMCYPRTGILYSLNFGDSHKNITAESSLLLLNAMGYGNRNTLWYLSQIQGFQHREAYAPTTPMGFLLQPDRRNTPEVPALPTSQIYPDFGWATLRNSWQKDATMLAVKSGFTWNHSHADANSFILFHKGVDIIKDAGNSGYVNPAYRNYFFQSQAHNVVLFNGQGQTREQQYHASQLRGFLYHLMDGGNTKYVLADGTGPVSDNFSRNFRHFLWIDNVIYLIDDLKTHKTGHFEWLWHLEGNVKKSGYDMNVTNGEASIAVRPLYPEMLAKSAFVHDYPNDMYVEEKAVPREDNTNETETCYAFHLPAEVNRVKGMTAIILRDDAKTEVETERRQGENWIGVRVKNGNKITDIYINQLADGRLMHLNSWITADGWTTDAYLTAISYKEGTDPAQATDIFMAYGSSLRRNEQVYFSSLAKLFFIQKEQDKTLNLQIQGQSRINAWFRSQKKPNVVTVNGKTVPVNYNRNLTKVITSLKRE